MRKLLTKLPLDSPTMVGLGAGGILSVLLIFGSNTKSPIGDGIDITNGTEKISEGMIIKEKNNDVSF